MIRDDFGSFIWRHHIDPALLGRRQTVHEIIQPLLEVGPVIWAKSSEFVEDFARNELPISRIQPIMRVSKRMNITLGARDLTCRHFENTHLQRSIQITVGADLHFGVATLLNERRQPTNLEIAANENKKVGLLQ